MSDPVLYTQSGGVATITLNRPEVLNALNRSLNESLLAAVNAASSDESIRAVVITGAGRAFCAGADLAGSASKAGAKLGDSLREHYHPIITGIREMPKPVIAAVNGPAAGAGMSIALSADIVLAGQSASFLQAFAKIGLIPDAGSTWLLDRYAGAMRGRALAMLAEKIPASDAKDYGLVWKIYADDELLTQATILATRMAQMPTRAFALIKQAMDSASSNDLATQLEVEADLQSEAGMTEDFREGVSAFLEKRHPAFKGR